MLLQPSSERDLFEEHHHSLSDGRSQPESKIHQTADPSLGGAAGAISATKSVDSLEDLDKAIEDIDINDVNASDIDDDELLADDDGTDLLSD